MSKIKLTVLGLVVTICGCSTSLMPRPAEQAVIPVSSDQIDNSFQSFTSKSVMPHLEQSARVKDINYYVRGLMHQLVENVKYVNETTPLAVASFVVLDSDLQTTNLIGNQIAESFVHEVHKFGIPVLDFKTTDYFRITPQGDFVFSRDFMELRADLPIEYALTGTMTRHQYGYLINARIIGVKSKAVVASAQGLLPDSAIDVLLNTNSNDGIPLRKRS